MSNKLGKADAFFYTCQCLWKVRNRDEGFLSVLCANIHQGFEFGLKYLIEMKGSIAPTVHHINVILAYLPEYVDEDWHKYLEQNCTEITRWYEEQKYAQEMSTLLRDIIAAMEVLENFINWLHSGSLAIDVKPSSEGRVTSVLLKLNSNIHARKLLPLLPTSISIMDDNQLFEAVKTALKYYSNDM